MSGVELPPLRRVYIPDTEAAERMGLATALRDDFDVRVGEELSTGEARLLATVGDAQALCVGLAHVSARVIEAAPDLRLVVKCGLGTDNIDLAAARARGVRVVRTWGVNYRGVAEFVIGTAIAAFRRFDELDRAVRAGEWSEARRAWAGRLPALTGRTIGIVGYGAIGRQLGRLAAAHEMRVLAFDPWIDAQTLARAGAEGVPLDELLACADVVSINCALTPETTHLIGAAQLRRMRPEAVLVNAARGPIVDERALAEALDAGELAFAALDVAEREPLDAASPLMRSEKVRLSPHLAGCTDAGYVEIGQLAAELVRATERGAPIAEPCVVVP